MVAARRRGQIKGHAACLRKALQKGSDQEADCIRSLQMFENCSCSAWPRSCSQHIGAMGKREQVTPVDQSVLDMALHSNKSWQDLGAYETISKAQAADGESLAMRFDLLKSLLLVQPEGQLLLTQVRASILKAVSLEPELNKTSLKNLLWAGSRFDRISTMLYHKNNTEKCQQLVAKSSSGSLAKVKSLIANQ